MVYLFIGSNVYPPQLHPLNQMWSHLAPKSQNGDGSNLKSSKWQSTNQGVTSLWFYPLYNISSVLMRLTIVVLCEMFEQLLDGLLYDFVDINVPLLQLAC